MRHFTKLLSLVSTLRVGHQLLGSFAILLLLIGLVGALALRSVEQSNSEANELAGKWLQGVGNLAVIKASVMETRAFEVKFSRADDASYRSEYEEKMKLAASLASTTLVSYQRLVSGAPERKLFDEFSKNWSTYQQAQQKVIELGNGSSAPDAADISDGLASMAADEATSTLEKLTAFNFSGGKAAAENANAVYTRTRTLVISLVAFALVLGVLLAFVISRSITQPLRMAEAVADAVAAGDLTMVFEASGSNETAKVLIALKTMSANLQTIVAQVRCGAELVATASSQIASGNLDLSSRTEQQASALEETASSMEELTSTVKQNADNARQANQLAVSASDVAVRGGRVVAQVVDTMESINASAKRIVDIIGVIDGIAFQTNILALNAAVEAARAGEQGRGFAVVATEVRNLAQRSAAAAKEIKTLIGDSVDKVTAGSKLVDQAGATMDEIVSSVRRVTDIMSEITAASAEQEAGIGQINRAITEMDTVTQQNAALVEEAAAAAASLQEQADELSQTVSVFNLDEVERAPAAITPRGVSPRFAVQDIRSVKQLALAQPSSKVGRAYAAAQ